MKFPQKLDLSQTISFIGLLKFQKEMAILKPGDRLVVILDNQDTVTDLQRIVGRSQDQITQIAKEHDRYIIDILKRNNTD